MLAAPTQKSTRELHLLIGDELYYKDGAVHSNLAKRAKTDASLKGRKGEFKASKDNAAAQAAIMTKVDEVIKGTYRVLLSRGAGEALFGARTRRCANI